ncbi:MAG: hypothetical protein L6R41_001469 [Letrouitia leprolyta]|nr:MAG: hypothetical protein L6R41_001469 [Letrouitia leprolyta]
MPVAIDLLKLPLEIRENIYFHAIMPDPEYRVNYNNRLPVFMQSPQRKPPILKEFPALLFVSKQVRAEAERVLYSKCTLVWRSHFCSATPQDLSAIPSHCIRWIHSVEYYYTGPCDSIDTSEDLRQEFETLVRLLPNLHNVTLSLAFHNGTGTSSADPKVVAENLEKLLGASLGLCRTATLYIDQDGYYGDEVYGDHQPDVHDIMEHLRKRLPKVRVDWSPGWWDSGWVIQIYDLDHPILLMGSEAFAKSRESIMREKLYWQERSLFGAEQRRLEAERNGL